MSLLPASFVCVGAALCLNPAFALGSTEYGQITDWVLSSSIEDETESITSYGYDDFGDYLESNEEDVIIVDQAKTELAEKESARSASALGSRIVTEDDVARGYFQVQNYQVFAKRRFFIKSKPVGQGNIAAVYKATDLKSNKHVAIKLPLPKLLNSDYGELLWGHITENNYRLFKICAKSTCLNANLFTRVAGRVTSELIGKKKLRGIMVEFVENADIDWKSLKYLGLKNTEKQGFELFKDIQNKLDLLSIVHNELISGVNFFRSRGLTHNDIKPGNLISGGDHIKINDFDTVAFIKKEPEEPKFFALTMEFASPEVLATKMPHINSDLFSTGMTLLNILFGETPSRRFAKAKFSFGRNFEGFSFEDQRAAFLRTYFIEENYRSMLNLIACMFDEVGFLLSKKGLSSTQITFVKKRLELIKNSIVPLLAIDPATRVAKKIPLNSIQNREALEQFLSPAKSDL